MHHAMRCNPMTCVRHAGGAACSPPTCAEESARALPAVAGQCAICSSGSSMEKRMLQGTVTVKISENGSGTRVGQRHLEKHELQHRGCLGDAGKVPAVQ